MEDCPIIHSGEMQHRPHSGAGRGAPVRAGLLAPKATWRCWAREKGCPWDFATRDIAAAEFGYTDYFGNLVDLDGNPIDEDDEYGYDEYPYV